MLVLIALTENTVEVRAIILIVFVKLRKQPVRASINCHNNNNNKLLQCVALFFRLS